MYGQSSLEGLSYLWHQQLQSVELQTIQNKLALGGIGQQRQRTYRDDIADIEKELKEYLFTKISV